MESQYLASFERLTLHHIHANIVLSISLLSVALFNITTF